MYPTPQGLPRALHFGRGLGRAGLRVGQRRNGGRHFGFGLRQRLRRRYSELVRRYHPDRNGGDRKFEDRLVRVVEAYQVLRKSSAFA